MGKRSQPSVLPTELAVLWTPLLQASPRCKFLAPAASAAVPHSRSLCYCRWCSPPSLPARWIDSWQPFLVCICLFLITTCRRSLDVCSAQSRLEKSFWRINLSELLILIIDGWLGAAGVQLPAEAGAGGHGEPWGWACKSDFQGTTLFSYRYVTSLFIAHLDIQECRDWGKERGRRSRAVLLVNGLQGYFRTWTWKSGCSIWKWGCLCFQKYFSSIMS